MADDRRIEITPDILLRAYAAGIFPMSEDADDPTLFWLEPRSRGIIPLDAVHVPRRLARTVRSDRFEIRVDTDFEGVIAGCAAAAPDRERTWINGRIRRLYGELFERGHCHTVEAWQDGQLVGGLYGIELGAAFFGESMFHLARDASKVAFVHLAARLRIGGYRLLDAQFTTAHLETFGAVEVPRPDYKRRLAMALEEAATWWTWPRTETVGGAAALRAFVDARCPDETSGSG